MHQTQQLVRVPRTSQSLYLRTDAALSELPHAPHKSNGARSTLALERQINELNGTFEDFKSANEQRQKTTDDTLACILEAVGNLTSANTTVPQAHSPSLSTVPIPSENKPILSNPKPTPELITIISKVVSEARNRVGKKGGGMGGNSCKVSSKSNDCNRLNTHSSHRSTHAIHSTVC
jgi:hypothetical protein